LMRGAVVFCGDGGKGLTFFHDFRRS
jgi:hypothetical protein